MPVWYPTKREAQKHRRKGEVTRKIVVRRKKYAPKHLPKKMTQWVNRKRKK